jgi:tetratricopeptide (TPR) repeat protein
MNRNRALALVIALAGLAIAAHWPALSGGFIWDDDDHLTQNPSVAAPGGLRDIWSSLAVSRYYPLTLTTFWAFRQIFQLNPLPYHALNLALHAANALLLWLVFRRLAVRGAWLATALWAVHPVMVESVAWITELKNTQSTFFMLAALGCYLDFEDTGRRNRYALALVAFAAALVSKPATVTLPVILLLCAWWQRNRLERADWWRAVPFFALSAGMSLVTIAEQHRHVQGAASAEWQFCLTDRLIVAGHAVWFYVGKLLAPVNLSFVYPRWDLRAANLVPGLLVMAVLAGLWRWRRQPWARAGFFGAACFVVALAPVLGFFDIYYFRFSFVADHFNYLPSAALLALVPATVATVLRDRRGQIIVGAVAIAVLANFSWQRATVFQNDLRLWRDTLAQNPDSGLAHNNLGAIYQRRGLSDAAIAEYEAAITLLPEMWEPWVNLGKLLTDRQEYDRAIACFRSTLAAHPELFEARYGLGVAAAKAGRLAEAESELTAALRLQPAKAHAHFWLGRVAEQNGDASAAIRQYIQTIRLEPRLLDAYLRLGELRLQRGDRGRAVNCFQTALRLKPGGAEATAGLRRAEELP